MRAVRGDEDQVEKVLERECVILESFFVLIVFAHLLELIVIDFMPEYVLELKNLQNPTIIDIVLEEELIEARCVFIDLTDRID